MRSDKMPKIMDKRRRTSTHKRQAAKRRVHLDTPTTATTLTATTIRATTRTTTRKKPESFFCPISSGLELSTLVGFVFKVAHKTLY